MAAPGRIEITFNFTGQDNLSATVNRAQGQLKQFQDQASEATAGATGAGEEAGDSFNALTVILQNSSAAIQKWGIGVIAGFEVLDRAIGLVKSGLESLSEGEMLANQSAVFRQLNNDAESYLITLERVSRGIISTSALQATSNALNAVNLTQEQIRKAVRIATDAAVLYGQSAQETLSELQRELIDTGKKELELAGIKMDVAKALEEEAAQTGRTVEQLTSAEVAVIKLTEASKKLKESRVDIDELAISSQKLTVALSNAGDRIDELAGEMFWAINRAFVPAVQTQTEYNKEWANTIALIERVNSGPGSELGANFLLIEDRVKNVARAMRLNIDETRRLTDAFSASVDPIARMVQIYGILTDATTRQTEAAERARKEEAALSAERDKQAAVAKAYAETWLQATIAAAKYDMELAAGDEAKNAARLRIRDLEVALGNVQGKTVTLADTWRWATEDIQKGAAKIKQAKEELDVIDYSEGLFFDMEASEAAQEIAAERYREEEQIRANARAREAEEWQAWLERTQELQDERLEIARQTAEEEARINSDAAIRSIAEISSALQQQGGGLARAGAGFTSLLSQIGNSFEALKKGSPAAIAALKSSAAAFTDSKIAQAAIAAAFELAAGFAAYPDPVGMASHFTAAALFGALAGASASGGKGAGGGRSPQRASVGSPAMQSASQGSTQPLVQNLYMAPVVIGGNVAASKDLMGILGLGQGTGYGLKGATA